MGEESFAQLLAGITVFGWHESKRAANLRKHKIDFRDVVPIINENAFVRRSDRRGEIRYQVFGNVHGEKVAVACTIEGSRCWIISARRASKAEKRNLDLGIEGQSSSGQD